MSQQHPLAQPEAAQGRGRSCLSASFVERPFHAPGGEVSQSFFVSDPVIPTMPSRVTQPNQLVTGHTLHVIVLLYRSLTPTHDKFN